MQVHAYVAILRMPTELRLVQAYYGYGRPRQQLRAYYCYGYGRSTATGTGVLRLRLRACYDYGYGRTTTMAMGVLRLRLRANVRAYYVNFFTAYTVRMYVCTVCLEKCLCDQIQFVVDVVVVVDHEDDDALDTL